MREGDIIHFDIPNRKLTLEVSDEEIAARLKDFKPPALRWPAGVFRKYVDRVTSAPRRRNNVRMQSVVSDHCQ